MRMTCMLAVGFVLAALGASAMASEPFTLTATGTSGSATASGHNVVDLVENVIQSKDQFASLSGSAFDATLRYGGLNNAVLFSRNAAGTSGTLTIPSTGFSKTFTADNETDLKNQIRDFLKKDGASEYAALLRTINQETTLGVSDGNPLSLTALMADGSFYRFGFQPARFDIGEGPHLPAGFDLDFQGGSTQSTDADGYYAGGGIGSTFRLGDRIGFALEFDARYINFDGSSVYQLANVDALPIQIIQPGVDGGLSWTLTPAFVAGFGGSWDLAAGGVTIGGQITSSLAVFAGGWTFILADQYGYYGGVPVEFSDFRFDTDVNQQILKNGVQVIRTIGAMFVDAGVSYTNFLNDAAIKNYWSAEAGIGLRFGESSGIRIGYHGDFSTGDEPRFTNAGGNVTFFLSY